MDKENKRFYWIKLREDFFQEETVDWLMDQENGSAYVVLYLRLCLLTANTDGELTRNVGDMVVPYSPKKIAQKTGFDIDTVNVGMALFKQLGLITTTESGTDLLPEVKNMVGAESATKEAIKKRNQRLKKKLEGTQWGTNCPRVKGTQRDTNCPTEIRDKRLENRDKSIEIREQKAAAAAGTATEDTGLQAAMVAYQKNIHPVSSPIERDQLVDLCQDYGSEWLIEAIKEAAIHNGRSIRYIMAILRRWQETGLAEPWKNKQSREKEDKQAAKDVVLTLLDKYKQEEAENDGEKG